MEPVKKRGRRPRGGTITPNAEIPLSTPQTTVQHVVLHLKCSSQDLNVIDFHLFSFEPYNTNEHTELSVGVVDISIHEKVKQLSTMLRINDGNDRSDCFWCTCPFDSPPIHLPRFIRNGQYIVYGSFCCPECAAGYLFQQPNDQSTKFEQFHLLNDLYGEAYDYSDPIIPAPSPHYLLKKYNGSLTIQEYRELVRSNQSILVVNKPIMSEYPEIIQYSIDTSGQSSKRQYALARKEVSDS